MPRAIAYYAQGFISFLLDGHHKACAAALAHKPVRCIAITPCSYYTTSGPKYEVRTMCFAGASVNASDVPKKYYPKFPHDRDELMPGTISSGNICNREWESEYTQSAKSYPNVNDYAILNAFGYYATPVTDEEIQRLIEEKSEEAHQRLCAIILHMSITNDPRLKQTAMQCVRQNPMHQLEYAAYKALCTLKGDKEVEQFFIDYIVYCDDKHDGIRQLIDTFWQE